MDSRILNSSGCQDLTNRTNSTLGHDCVEGTTEDTQAARFAVAWIERAS